MFDKYKEIKRLKKENDELKLELERLKAYEEIHEGALAKCNELSDRLRQAIFEAKQAQGNYMTLYKELLKNINQ